MANTVVQIKRSGATATPTGLANGELAYSFNSANLFIGNGATSIVIGGKYITDKVEAATPANSASTIVRRDVNGNVEVRAATAGVYLYTDILTASANTLASKDYVDGKVGAGGGVSQLNDLTDVIFSSPSAGQILVYDGVSPASANMVNRTLSGDATLANTGALTIAAGAITNPKLQNSSISVVTSNGVTSNVSTVALGGAISIFADSTVVRTTGDQSIGGVKTFTGTDMIVQGNLYVTGTRTFANTETVQFFDNILTLNSNFTTGTPTENAGIEVLRGSSATVAFRWNETTDKWEITKDGTNYFALVDLEGGQSIAGTTTINTLTLTNALTVTNGGTGLNAVATGDILYASGTNTMARLAANAAGNVLISGTTPAWGKVNVQTMIAGVLPAANGGTGFATYTVGDILYADTGSTLARLAGAATGNVLISGGAGVAPAYGKVGLTTHVSGTLPTGNGGTGLTTFTNNGVLYASSTSALGFVSSATEGHVLQVSVTGVPTFAMLDGGSY